MSEQNAPFLDQCRCVCLNYFLEKINTESDKDEDSAMTETIKCELGGFEFKTQGYISAARTLSEISSTFLPLIYNKLEQAAKELDKEELTEEIFEEATKKYVQEAATIESWEEVAMLVHLVYLLHLSRGIPQLVTVVDVGARCLRRRAKVFVAGEGGWVFLPLARAEEQEGISSSIVMVPSLQEEQAAGDRVPPAGSFSVLSPVYDEEVESLNSATPPELVDRPPMTSSLMQMMGEGDAPNTGSSESPDFEMVGSYSNSAPGSPKQPEEPPKPSLVSQLKPFAATSKPDEVDTTPPEGASVSDYIPHISIGVAAAAACIGFLMLKKAT